MARSRLVLAVVTGLLLVGLLGAVVARGGTPFGVDAALHRWMLEHRTPGWTGVLTEVTRTGYVVLPYLAAAVAGALAVVGAGRSNAPVK
ncbi:hypothetical protein GL263_27795, partial [Streptomyces durbertensis]|nr:hypothetical protein [Streptomyces durbertensis]